ncbi:MAG: hypothetical protein AAGG68_18940 [Bacteroidota bacterium]
MERLADQLYWYCTDFCINAANLLGISYVEFNFWLFLVLMPSLTALLFVVNILKFVKKKAKQK